MQPAPPIREILQAAFDAAVAAGDPQRCLAPLIPPAPERGRTLLAAVGKAAVPMARAYTARCAGNWRAVVVAPAVDPLAAGTGLEVIAAAHPVPDQRSVAAADRVLALAREATAADRFVLLISGGASALLAKPRMGVSLADKQGLARQLLESGAGIAAVNAVRRKFSAIKGGRLAAATGAGEIRVFAISDVPGDRVADIGSGPCSPDPMSRDEVQRILAHWSIQLPEHLQWVLSDPSGDAPPPSHPAFARTQASVVARSADAVAAAGAVLTRAGYRVVTLPEANDLASAVAASHAARVREFGIDQPIALISGGETTVQVTNPHGRGGRNSAYLLALALALAPAGIHALAADTDGIDGSGNNAGAYLRPDSISRAAALGLEPGALLSRNCSLDFFAALDDLLVTGPTGVNLNDLRILLLGQPVRMAP